MGGGAVAAPALIYSTLYTRQVGLPTHGPKKLHTILNLTISMPYTRQPDIHQTYTRHVSLATHCHKKLHTIVKEPPSIL